MFSSNKYLISFLFFIVLISRLPFLTAGYGVEEDSWGIALAAFHTKLSGLYEPSRFPGHPVQELLYSALWGVRPFVFNGLCAIFSAIATVFFALILKHLNFRFYFLAALAFAFTPVVFISSTYTIDFLWSEAFVLMSLYFLLKEKLFLTGVFLGLAIGCRITCGAMLLPFMVIVWENGSLKNNLGRLVKMTIPMSFVALLAFLPIILQFGTSFFMYYDQFPYPPMAKVIYKISLGVVGFIGFSGLVIGWSVFVLKRSSQTSGMLFVNGLSKKIVMVAFIVLVLYAVSYFRLPQKSGYMIPVIPFIIILSGYYLNERLFKWICYSLIASSFVFGINLTDKLRGAEHSKLAVTFHVAGQEVFIDPLSGPIFSDYSKRKQKMEYTNEVIEKTNSKQFKTVVISGWWYNEIMVTSIGKDLNPNVVFEPYITELQIKKYVSENYTIVYLPEQNTYNDQMYNMNITDQYAKPF